MFSVSLQFLIELNNNFHLKGLKRFQAKLIEDRRKTKQEKKLIFDLILHEK